MSDLALTKGTFAEINRLHRAAYEHIKMGAETMYKIGEMLAEIKERRDCGITWKAFVEENFEFSTRVANNYIKFYLVHSGQEHVVGTIEAHKRLGDALPEGFGEGFDETPGGPIQVYKRQHRNDLSQGQLWEELFSREPYTKVGLVNHRVHYDGRGHFTVFDKTRHEAYSSVSIIHIDQALQDYCGGQIALEIQGVLEKYYERLEQEKW